MKWKWTKTKWWAFSANLVWPKVIIKKNMFTNERVSLNPWLRSFPAEALQDVYCLHFLLVPEVCLSFSQWSSAHLDSGHGLLQNFPLLPILPSEKNKSWSLFGFPLRGHGPSDQWVLKHLSECEQIIWSYKLQNSSCCFCQQSHHQYDPAVHLLICLLDVVPKVFELMFIS